VCYCGTVVKRWILASKKLSFEIKNTTVICTNEAERSLVSTCLPLASQGASALKGKKYARGAECSLVSTTKTVLSESLKKSD
jgi:hypothetical protein